MFAAILGITACSTEMPVDNEELASLSILLSAESTATKAIGDTILPRYEEVIVNRYHVAIFERTGNTYGNRIASVEYGVDGKPILPIDEDNGPLATKYKALFTDIPEGDIAVYVIANYPEDWTFEDANWGTYDEYTKQIVTTAPFIDKELVKVGLKEVTVTKETRQIELKLIQLTAGIDVTIKSSGDAGFEEGPESGRFLEASAKIFGVYDENDIDKYIGRDSLISTILKNLKYNEEKPLISHWASDITADDGDWTPAGKKWLDGGNRPGLSKAIKPERGALYFRAEIKNDPDKEYNGYDTDFKIVAYGRYVDYEFSCPIKGFITGATTVAGLNKKSNITIYSDQGSENTEYEGMQVDSFNSRCYTYESLKDTDQKISFNIEVGTGESKNIYRRKFLQYGYTIYRGQWINKDDHSEGYSWTLSSLGLFPMSVWLDAKGGKVITEKEFIRNEKGEGTLKDPRTYSIDVSMNKIIKGHLYQVTGTYTPSIHVTPTIEWVVMDWTKNETVDIPTFE